MKKLLAIMEEHNMIVAFKVDSFIFRSWDDASRNHLSRKQLRHEASNFAGLVSLGDLMAD